MTHDLELVAFRVPMRLRFRRTDVRTGVLVRGPAGWGEFSPFPEYDDDYAARWWRAAEEAATWPWPAAVRHQVPVNVTVPALAPDAAAERVRASGCSTAKVKVAEPGQSLAEDLDRVAAVRAALGPDGRIRIDANAAWDVEQAVHAVNAMAAYGLEYVEQPCATLGELAEVRRRTNVPVAADESVRTAEDPLTIAARGAADILVLKVQPLGGVTRALEIAEAAGLPVVVSSALETSVGLAAGLAFAAALPDLPYACGLATVDLLADDVVALPLLAVDGELAVRRPDVDREALLRVRPPQAEADALLARAERARTITSTYR